VDREIVQLSRGLRAGSRKDEKRANVVLRRHLEATRKQEMEAAQARRKQAFDRRRRIAKAKAAMAKAKLAKEARLKEKEALAKKQKAEAEEKAAKLRKLPLKVSSKDLGTFTAKGEAARRDALERIKLNSPALSEDRELRWEYVRDRFAKEPPLHLATNAYKGGCEFVHGLDLLLRLLSVHYQGRSMYNGKEAKGKGDPEALHKFFDKMDASLKPIGVEVLC